MEERGGGEGGQHSQRESERTEREGANEREDRSQLDARVNAHKRHDCSLARTRVARAGKGVDHVPICRESAKGRRRRARRGAREVHPGPGIEIDLE